MILDLVCAASAVRASVVDNSAHLDRDGHCGGYNGLSSLTHTAHLENIFVPAYSGLNLELYFDGVVWDRGRLFEPRHAPMSIHRVDEATVELHQPPTPYWQVESWTTFTVRAPNYVDFQYRAVPHAATFQQGWLGVFWASYILHPEDMGLWFPVQAEDSVRWIRHYSPSHGVESTHRNISDTAVVEIQENQQNFMYGNYSSWRYARPYFCGISHGMRFLWMVDDSPDIRFAQSPSGGGGGCPAWDFQLVVPNYEVGREYTLSGRLVCSQFANRDDCASEYARWMEFRKSN
jgi:hypothetical protein